MRDYHNMALFWGVSLLSEGKALHIRRSEHSVDLGQIQQPSKLDPTTWELVSPLSTHTASAE